MEKLNGLNCIICTEFCAWSCSEYDVNETLPPVNDGISCYSNGITCRANGNYGSTVFDPLGDNAFLEFVVCDQCLTKRKELFMMGTVLKAAGGKKFTYEPFAGSAED